MMQRLNLTSKEADPLVLEDEGDDDLPCPEWALVGKVLAPNTLHINTIRAVVRPAWGNPKDLVVNPLGPNIFLAEFGSEADRSRVAKGGPWKLSNHAILLKKFDVLVQPEDVVFDELLIWARIMNLSFDMMNSERGTPLALTTLTWMIKDVLGAHICGLGSVSILWNQLCGASQFSPRKGT
jgi:hypothetical protein